MTQAVWALPPAGSGGLGGVLKYSDSTPSSTAQNLPFAGPIAPALPPLIGIYSGKPMPNWPVQPSISATDDRASPDDDELYQRWRRWLDA